MSALFEALERYAVLLARPDGRHSVDEICAQDVLPLADVVHRVHMTHPTARLETWSYVGHGNSEVVYPTLITNPFLGTAEAGGSACAEAYLRYSSGLGTAAGETPEGAILHGLLELIEHDAISLAYLGWFVDGSAPVRAVSPSAMPDDVAAAASAITNASGRPIHLIDITTDLGVPVFLAILEHPSGDIPVYGSAAGCSGREAAIRALGEVEQMWALLGHAPEIERSLERWPVLERCRRLDIAAIRREIVTPAFERQSKDDDLDAVTAALDNAGLRSFHRSLGDPASEIAVVSCLVPGLERFSLVRSGSPVVPTGRGRAIWERSIHAKM